MDEDIPMDWEPLVSVNPPATRKNFKRLGDDLTFDRFGIDIEPSAYSSKIQPVSSPKSTSADQQLNDRTASRAKCNTKGRIALAYLPELSLLHLASYNT